MPLSRFVVYEYDTIRKISTQAISLSISTSSDVFVPDTTFELLKKLVFSQNADTILSFSIYKGVEIIKLKNFVGLLQTADGSQFEILPKLSRQSHPIQARQGLLKMLRYSHLLAFRSISLAHLNQANLPLLEIFITVFIQETEQIVRQGLQKTYQTIENEHNFLKGKWLPSRQKPHRLETFFTASDEFKSDIVPNRLLKSCVLFLIPKSQHLPNQVRLRHLRFALEEVSTSSDIKLDFEKISQLDRRFDRYQKALQWAKVLLSQQSWATQGQHFTDSLLFPTERLFEQYVAQGFKKYLSDFEVFYQEDSLFLVNDHAGKRRFGLRPDLVVRKANLTIVLDIKWKWIEPQSPSYGIEQSDLYQLYAYGHKYAAKSLYLLYPAHDGFQVPLPPFYFEENLSLIVFPFDISAHLPDEIEKIKTHFQQKTDSVY